MIPPCGARDGSRTLAGSYAYADYSEKPDPSHRPLYLDTVLAMLGPIGQGAAVLDAGCGGGDFAVGLSEAGYRIFGSDLSPSAIAHAQGLGVGQFTVASLYEPLAEPFGRERFDAIVCVDVIEHLYNPRVFVEHAFAALGPGGVMVITTPYWGYLKNIALALTNRMDRSLTALWEGGHIKHFSRQTLSQLMRNAGFEVVAFKGCGEGMRRHVPYLWSAMAMAFRKPGEGFESGASRPCNRGGLPLRAPLPISANTAKASAQP